MSATKEMVWTRLPIEEGDFRLYLYRDAADGKDHLAFVCGEIAGQEAVLTRIHSECFTGDVLGSLRCDCGPQLHEALRIIGQAGKGVLLYLRQEGRGIGLLDKLRAYNLQDQGLDTVDANLQLGHAADARDYSMAALMLKDLQVKSVQLITNNPTKIQALQELGVPVRGRTSLVVPVNPESERYIQTKVKRMEHLLCLDRLPRKKDELESWLEQREIPHDRPLVTITYAQSVDGSIALHPGKPLQLSGPESQTLTHRLRRWHDGILVGIGTVLADDPQLTVRLVQGDSPRPIVVDSKLRFPKMARMLKNHVKPWIATCSSQRGPAETIPVPPDPNGRVELGQLLRILRQRGIRHLMVEGGATVLRAFLQQQLADVAIVTIAPTWVGGLSALGHGMPFPKLSNGVWRQTGEDMVLWATLDWEPGSR